MKKDRRQAYLDKKRAFDAEIEAERQKRLEERREKRIEERREKWLEDCAREEARLRHEEEEAARKAEEERLEAERQVWSFFWQFLGFLGTFLGLFYI